MPAAQTYLKNLLISLALGSLKNFSLSVTQSTLITIVKKIHFCQVGAKFSFRMLQIMKTLHFPAEVLGPQRQKVTSPQPLRSQESSEVKMHCKTPSPEA